MMHGVFDTRFVFEKCQDGSQQQLEKHAIATRPEKLHFM